MHKLQNMRPWMLPVVVIALVVAHGVVLLSRLFERGVGNGSGIGLGRCVANQVGAVRLSYGVASALERAAAMTVNDCGPNGHAGSTRRAWSSPRGILASPSYPMAGLVDRRHIRI